RLLSRERTVVTDHSGYRRLSGQETGAAGRLLPSSHLDPFSLRRLEFLLYPGAGQTDSALSRLASHDSLPPILQKRYFPLARGRFGAMAGTVHPDVPVPDQFLPDEACWPEHCAVQLSLC